MRRSLPIWLLFLLLFSGACAVSALLFWDLLSDLIEAYEAPLKVLSLVLGPLATVGSIYWGYKSKQDLVDLSTAQAEAFAKDATEFSSELANKSEQLGFVKAEAERARAEASERGSEAERALAVLDQRGRQIEALEDDLRRITEGSSELWKLRDRVAELPDYKVWLRDPSGAKIVTVANLKGGVGKTTLSANLAAYVSEKYRQSVLLIDLDYQGSLSNMLMQAAEKEVVHSAVDDLLEASEENPLARLSRRREQLDPKLPRVWLVPASYTLAQMENKLLLKWLLKSSEGVDVRYRLASILLHPTVRREYKLIILDTPPRMTIGTVNALVSSHFYLVPTALDRLSAEAVPQFVTNMVSIKKDLDLDIHLAGIAGTMSRQKDLNANELLALERAREGGEIWEPGSDFVLKQTIPRRSAISDAAGGGVAYFEKDGSNRPLTELFDPLFEEICENIGLK